MANNTPYISDCQDLGSKNIYKPTLFTEDSYPCSSQGQSPVTTGRRSVRFSSVECAQPVGRSSLLTEPTVRASLSADRMRKIPKLTAERNTDGFFSVQTSSATTTVPVKRPKNKQQFTVKKPIAESTDLKLMDTSQPSFITSDTGTDPRGSHISRASLHGNDSNSEVTEVVDVEEVVTRPASSAGHPNPSRRTKTVPSKRNPFLLPDKAQEKTLPQPQVPAEQDVPEHQYLTAKLLQAEYVLFLLRNERLQHYRAFCSFVYSLLINILNARSEQAKNEMTRGIYAALEKTTVNATTTLGSIAERATLTLTPAAYKQISSLNNAVEACTSLHIKDLSLVPMGECAEGLLALNRKMAELLNYVEPIEAGLTVDSIGNLNANVISNLCRSAAKLQALAYEAAVLVQRQVDSKVSNEAG